MIAKNVQRLCCEDLSLVENYDKTLEEKVQKLVEIVKLQQKTIVELKKEIVELKNNLDLLYDLHYASDDPNSIF